MIKGSGPRSIPLGIGFVIRKEKKGEFSLILALIYIPMALLLVQFLRCADVTGDFCVQDRI